MFKFNPLTINKHPNKNTNIGINRLILFLKLILIKFDRRTAENITGKVPHPKNNINNAPSTTFPEAIAPPIAA